MGFVCLLMLIVSGLVWVSKERAHLDLWMEGKSPPSDSAAQMVPQARDPQAVDRI